MSLGDRPPPRRERTTWRDERALAAPGVRPPAALAPSARYVLERQIAEGGMGRIFLGRDLHLERPVAIKVLLERAPQLLRRFEREARITAKLVHPGIVTVHDLGFSPAGEPYLVKNLVRGRSLDRAIAEAETLEERLALLPHVIAAADAMAYAHDQGIIHRDLKPSNVLVGAFGEVVIVDWGLAKELAKDQDAEPEPGDGRDRLPGAPPRRPGLSAPGAVLGTPAYMAPEQAAGGATDARADVFALGAILYHVLTGAPPRAGERTSDVVGLARTEPPAPLAALEPRLPSDLHAIVARAMAFEPAGRYPTAFELADDLKRLQTGQLVAARRYSPGALARRWVARHRLLAAGLALALAALGARLVGL